MERLFLAIRPPVETCTALVAAQDSMQRGIPGGRVRWTPADQFHFTLQFLGNVPPRRCDALAERLAALPPALPFEVRLTDIGAFPSMKQPRVIWIGTTAPRELVGLHARTARVISSLRLDADRRPFVPHVTIGMMDEHAEPLKTEAVFVPKVAFEVDRFVLMRSVAGPRGSAYEIVREFPLGR